jgi:hypothetical protein
MLRCAATSPKSLYIHIGTFQCLTVDCIRGARGVKAVNSKYAIITFYTAVTAVRYENFGKCALLDATVPMVTNTCADCRAHHCGVCCVSGAVRLCYYCLCFNL